MRITTVAVAVVEGIVTVVARNRRFPHLKSSRTNRVTRIGPTLASKCSQVNHLRRCRVAPNREFKRKTKTRLAEPRWKSLHRLRSQRRLSRLRHLFLPTWKRLRLRTNLTRAMSQEMRNPMTVRLLRAHVLQTVPTSTNSHIVLRAVAPVGAVAVHRRQKSKNTGQMATCRSRAR